MEKTADLPGPVVCIHNRVQVEAIHSKPVFREPCRVSHAGLGNAVILTDGLLNAEEGEKAKEKHDRRHCSWVCGAVFFRAVDGLEEANDGCFWT
jgi:hypothetical protein